MHRKFTDMARTTGLYPLAVLSDRVVHPSPGESPHDVLPSSRTPVRRQRQAAARRVPPRAHARPGTDLRSSRSSVIVGGAIASLRLCLSLQGGRGEGTQVIEGPQEVRVQGL